ncbi:hypothetical protein BYT27DRAFT_7258493 [Phlegmacium glaucopus]|nr:hypothetical protein BYT27DRAFT_7258493 [Phlegmacium glaucopus]
MSGKTAQKKVKMPATRNRSALANARDSSPSVINNAAAARRYLERRLLFVPEGHPATTATLATALHQIAAIDRIPKEAVEAIQAVAYMLDELDEGIIAATARDAVNDQLAYMNDELKTLTGHFLTTMENEMGKHLATVAEATKGLASTTTKSYKEALLSNNPTPANADPRILAREGIKARQFLLDFPDDLDTRELSQADIVKRFNEAIAGAGGNATVHKIRSVERLANKGLLGEFLRSLHSPTSSWRNPGGFLPIPGGFLEDSYHSW